MPSGPFPVWPDYLKLNPMGSIPTLVGEDLVLTESGAMINRIIEKYGGGKLKYPALTKDAARVDEWMFWSEGLFDIHQRYFWDHATPSPACLADPVSRLGEAGRRQAIKYAHMLEAALRADGFAVGDTLTAADFMLCFPLYQAHQANWFENLPKIRASIDRFSTRPAFQSALADSTPYAENMFGVAPSVVSWRQWEDTWRGR